MNHIAKLMIVAAVAAPLAAAAQAEAPYPIGDYAALRAFAELVNNGKTGANALPAGATSGTFFRTEIVTRDVVE